MYSKNFVLWRIKLKIKNNYIKTLLCFIAISMAMLFMGLYSSYITKESINNNTFDIRTKTELLELNKLEHGKIKQLLFEKSSFFMGSIINSTDKNFHVDKLFCQQLNNNLYTKIINHVEAKTSLSEDTKNKFYKKFQLLIKKCQYSQEN